MRIGSILSFISFIVFCHFNCTVFIQILCYMDMYYGYLLSKKYFHHVILLTEIIRSLHTVNSIFAIIADMGFRHTHIRGNLFWLKKKKTKNKLQHKSIQSLISCLLICSTNFLGYLQKCSKKNNHLKLLIYLPTKTCLL